jgi:multidrug efflux system membrane fusion protein
MTSACSTLRRHVVSRLTPAPDETEPMSILSQWIDPLARDDRSGARSPRAPRPLHKVATVPVQVASVTTISAPLTIGANGVVEPLQTVAVQAQVNGTLDVVNFREGVDVQEGQILFRIDARPYEATLRQMEASLARDEAAAQNAQRDAERYKALVEKDYVTKSQADQIASAAVAARATVQADSATVDNAKLNLNYTTIRSPIRPHGTTARASGQSRARTPIRSSSSTSCGPSWCAFRGAT